MLKLFANLRELFLLVVVVALGLSLYLERNRNHRLNHKLSTLRHYARLKGWDIVTVAEQGGWSFLELPPFTGWGDRRGR